MNERFTIMQEFNAAGSALFTYISHRVWDGIEIVFEDRLTIASPTPTHQAEFMHEFTFVRQRLEAEGFSESYFDSIPPYWLFERDIQNIDHLSGELSRLKG